MKMRDASSFILSLYLMRGWGLWALAWAFTGSRKFFFSYWKTGFLVDATWNITIFGLVMNIYSIRVDNTVDFGNDDDIHLH